MYLMKMTEFNGIIDELVAEQGCTIAMDDFDFMTTEFINVSKFKKFFSEKEKPPHSMMRKSIEMEGSAFLKMLCMNNVFVVRNDKQTFFSGN